MPLNKETKPSSLALLLYLFYLCFNIAGPYGVVLCYLKRSILFFSHDQVFSHEISLACRLKYPYSSFSFHFFFCFLVVGGVLCILGLFVFFSGRCNKSFFALSNVVFESSYPYNDAILNDFKYSSSFLDT